MPQQLQLLDDLPAPLPEGIDISQVPGAISAAVRKSEKIRADAIANGTYPTVDDGRSDAYAELGGGIHRSVDSPQLDYDA